MPNANTVIELPRCGKDDAVALAAPGRNPASFSDLRAHVDFYEAIRVDLVI